MAQVSRRSLMVGSVAVATCAATAAPGAQAVSRDPYYPSAGDAQYGVSHYEVANSILTNGSAATRIAGTTTMTARAFARLRSLDVDIALPVSRVQVNGSTAKVSRLNGRAVRVSGIDVPAGASFSVAVSYDGYPARVAKTGDVITGSNAISFIGEPCNGPYWHACNDRIDNKATYGITVWTQRANTVIGPGVLQSRSNFMSGSTAMTAHRFVLDAPVSSYLPNLQVGRYATTATSVVAGGVSVPLTFGAVGSVPATLVTHTKASLQYFASLYGPYPFAEGGGVSAGGNWNGLWGMESVTRPTYSPVELGGARGPALVAHENAHQWFGNSMTGATWRDVPLLHEGFAVLLEKDYCETHGGLTSAYRPQPSKAAGNPGAGNFAWNSAYGVMRELRRTMDGSYVQANAPRFTAMMRDLASTYRHSSVTRAQFKGLAQAYAGSDLTRFWGTYGI